MPIHNTDIGDIFNRVADLLEIQGANQFRVRAYRNAARTVSGLPHRIADMVEKDQDLSDLPGIGKDLSQKIKEAVRTGTLSQLKELESKVPPELTKVMKVSGLGPKRARALYEQRNVSDLKDLKSVAEKGQIKSLEGFGKKTEQMILEALKDEEAKETRIKLVEAEERAHALVDYLKRVKDIEKVTVAGSFRRRKETVGDLDILVTCSQGSAVMDDFVNYEDVTKVISKGDTRSSVVLRSGLQVDLRVLPRESYGAALHYFTGSKAHNVAVRKIGVQKKLKINEYGVFKGNKLVAGQDETGVYAQVGLPFIEPELRENQGEIEAALDGSLPQLIETDHILGDLHVHTKATDGRHSIEQMAKAAQDRGYRYLAITEHSKRVSMAHGLDAERLAEQISRIDRLNETLGGPKLLKGIEVDILEDGSLDLPNSILKKLDLTVCSVHYRGSLSREKQTERIIRAMDNPYFNILAHPTGRLINEREPYDVDMEQLMRAALERGCFMELNSHPDRLDLTDRHCRMAKDMGLKVAVSTDAHSVTDLEFLRYGIGQARRGWLEPGDVLNTRKWEELESLLQRS